MDRRPGPESEAKTTCEHCAGLRFIQYAVLLSGESHPLPPRISDLQVQQNWPGARIYAEDCPCEKARHAKARHERLLNASNVPPNYCRYSFASWDALPEPQRAEKQFARQVMAAFATNGHSVTVDNVEYAGVVLSGPKGISKSGLAASAINQVLARGDTAAWLDFSEFLEKVKATYSYHSDDPRPRSEQIINAAGTTPLLLFDDMGNPEAERPASDDVQRIVFNVLNKRYAALLPTIITTNLTFERFSWMFGGRLADRVYERCYWVDMAGANLRYG